MPGDFDLAKKPEQGDRTSDRMTFRQFVGKPADRPRSLAWGIWRRSCCLSPSTTERGFSPANPCSGIRRASESPHSRQKRRSRYSTGRLSLKIEAVLLQFTSTRAGLRGIVFSSDSGIHCVRTWRQKTGRELVLGRGFQVAIGYDGARAVTEILRVHRGN